MFTIIPSGSYAQQYLQLNGCNDFTTKNGSSFVLCSKYTTTTTDPDLAMLYSKFKTIDSIDDFTEIKLDLNKKDHFRFHKFQPNEVIATHLQSINRLQLPTGNYIMNCLFLGTELPTTELPVTELPVTSNCCVFITKIIQDCTSEYYKKAINTLTINPNMKFTFVGDKKDCQKLIKHLRIEKLLNYKPIIVKKQLNKNLLHSIINANSIFIIDNSPESFYCINNACIDRKIKVIRPKSLWSNDIRQQELPITPNNFEICHTITTKRLVLFPFCYEQIQKQTLKPNHIFVTVDKKNVSKESIIEFKSFCDTKPDIIYEIKNLPTLSDLRNSNCELLKKFYKVTAANTNDYLPSKDNNKIIICAQDDDDYYPSESTFKRCLPIIEGYTELTGQENGMFYNIGDRYIPSETLTGSEDDYSIKTNSLITIYFNQFMTTNNFITYTMDYINTHKYLAGKKYAEESHFLESHAYTNNMYQIKGYPVCIAINHGHNTVDKRSILERIKRSGRIVELPNDFVLRYIPPEHVEHIKDVIKDIISISTDSENINPFRN